MMKIPKIIHYCWFGDNELPNSSKKYIKGWKQKCPDYKIVRWSEKNFPINKYLFTRKAYKYKNWAAVSDYVRFISLYKFGGIYLDTDVELLKPLNPFLFHDMFVGTENYGSKNYDEINTGLICGVSPHNVNILRIIKIYNKISKNKNFKDHANDQVRIMTTYFRKLGFKYKNKTQIINGCFIYPTYYFAPIKGNKSFDITNKTFSIHHYFGSWMSKKQKLHLFEGNIIKHLIGTKLYVYLHRKYLNIKDNY